MYHIEGDNMSQTDYDISEGDELEITIRSMASGDEQTGTMTALADQQGGTIQLEDTHGRTMKAIFAADLGRKYDDSIAGLMMQGDKIAEVIDIEVA